MKYRVIDCSISAWWQSLPSDQSEKTQMGEILQIVPKVKILFLFVSGEFEEHQGVIRAE